MKLTGALSLHRNGWVAFTSGMAMLIGCVSVSAQSTFLPYASTLNAAGRLASNQVALAAADYDHVYRLGGLESTRMTGGAWSNYSGPLHQADLKLPTRDTDGNGVIDELDPDNDGDHVSDSNEVVADTDPLSAASVLRLTAITNTLTGVSVHWEGGQAAKETLERWTLLLGPPLQLISVSIHTVSPPTPVSNQYTDATLPPVDPNQFKQRAFYRLKAER